MAKYGIIDSIKWSKLENSGGSMPINILTSRSHHVVQHMLIIASSSSME